MNSTILARLDELEQLANTFNSSGSAIANRVSYVDGVPALGTTTVQGAIDKLKAPLNVAATDNSAVVQPAPANQTGNNIDVLAAVLTPIVSGRFSVKFTFGWTLSGAATITFGITCRTKAAGIVIGNGTATGLNCFFATGAGSITYGGGTTNSVLFASPIIVPAGSLSQASSFAFDVIPNGNNAITIGNNLAIALTVSVGAATISGMSGAVRIP